MANLAPSQASPTLVYKDERGALIKRNDEAWIRWGNGGREVEVNLRGRWDISFHQSALWFAGNAWRWGGAEWCRGGWMPLPPHHLLYNTPVAQLCRGEKWNKLLSAPEPGRRTMKRWNSDPCRNKDVCLWKACTETYNALLLMQLPAVIRLRRDGI